MLCMRRRKAECALRYSRSRAGALDPGCYLLLLRRERGRSSSEWMLASRGGQRTPGGVYCTQAHGARKDMGWRKHRTPNKPTNGGRSPPASWIVGMRTVGGRCLRLGVAKDRQDLGAKSEKRRAKRLAKRASTRVLQRGATRARARARRQWQYTVDSAATAHSPRSGAGASPSVAPPPLQAPSSKLRAPFLFPLRPCCTAALMGV
jgi:hypothetical protein